MRLINRISSLGTTPTNFMVPMTKTFITQHFRPEAIQVSSGESVVIINQATSKVYKKPINLQEVIVLAHFLKEHTEKNLTLHHTILPSNCIQVRHVDFYEFTLCSPPLIFAEALVHLKDYVSSVSEAIVELHDSGYAHLDIRPENICFVDERAVLIDLDRCCFCDDEVLEKYGRSEMYKCVDRTWTAENLDWKQFGLMITNIMEARTGINYHLPISDGLDDPFIKELKLEAHSLLVTMQYFIVGNFDQNLLEEWLDRT